MKMVASHVYLPCMSVHRPFPTYSDLQAAPGAKLTSEETSAQGTISAAVAAAFINAMGGPLWYIWLLFGYILVRSEGCYILPCVLHASPVHLDSCDFSLDALAPSAVNHLPCPGRGLAGVHHGMAELLDRSD